MDMYKPTARKYYRGGGCRLFYWSEIQKTGKLLLQMVITGCARFIFIDEDAVIPCKII